MSKIFQWTIFRAYLLFSDHDGPMLADSVTYRALFSVFASVLLGFAVAGLWFGGNPQAMTALSEALNRTIPGIGDIVDVDTLDAPVSFTLAGLISLGGLLTAAVGAARSLRSALHQLSDNEFVKSPVVPIFLKDLGVAVGFGLLIGLAAAASFATSLGLGNIATRLGAPENSAVFNLLGRTAGVVVIFVIDVLAVAMVFALLSGMKTKPRILWSGAALGGVGLLVLQEFSGMFVSGATANPLLASFAALIVLLLWFNLSSQVILLASSWIIVKTWKDTDDPRALQEASNMDDWEIGRAKARVEVAKLDLTRTEKRVAAAKARREKILKRKKSKAK